LLGSALIRRLIGAGFEVFACDVDEARQRTIADLGAVSLQSNATLIERCGVVLVAVFGTEQVEDVISEAAAHHRRIQRPAPVIICVSTCDPDRLAALALRVAPEGIRVLEMPLSGTSRQVAEGAGFGLIGGERQLMDEYASILEAVCPKRVYLGDIGNASRAKLAVNLVLGLNRAAIAEGLIFAECLGLDRHAFLDVARASAAYSAAMDTKGPLMAVRKFANPHSRVDQSLKDFHMIIEQAAVRGHSLPFATVYAKMLEDCVQNGESSWDNAAIVEAIARQRDR
jgi:3-hydroxyisobutyrate dehydrogenase-like beta-hydroxyacid dehydrogenase